MPQQLSTYVIVALIRLRSPIFALLTIVATQSGSSANWLGHMQNRWGPTRVGPFGLPATLADGLKFILKEDIVPTNVYKPLYIGPRRAFTDLRAVVSVGNSDRNFGDGDWSDDAAANTPTSIWPC